MSERDGAPSIANESAKGPVIFAVQVYASGAVTWQAPKTGDPMMDEIILRGWLDKVREIALTPPSRSPLAI